MTINHICTTGPASQRVDPDIACAHSSSLSKLSLHESFNLPPPTSSLTKHAAPCLHPPAQIHTNTSNFQAAKQTPAPTPPHNLRNTASRSNDTVDTHLAHISPDKRTASKFTQATLRNSHANNACRIYTRYYEKPSVYAKSTYKCSNSFTVEPATWAYASPCGA